VQVSEIKLRLAYNLALAELNILKEELERGQSKKLQKEQFHLADIQFVRAISSDSANQFRGIDFDNYLEMFVVGSSKNTSSGKNFGLAKVSWLDPGRIDTINNLHGQLIKSIKCSPFGDSAVLTTAFDRTLKLSSLQTNGALLSYNLDSPGWSCCFDPEDRNNIFVGMGNGKVCMFDIRNTREAIWTHSTILINGDPLPVHSISVNVSEKGRRIIAGNILGPISLHVDEQGQLDTHTAGTPAPGQCSSFISNQKTNSWIMSVRGNTNQHIFGLYDDKSFDAKIQYNCEAAQTSMVRPSILDYEGKALIAYPDGPNTRVSLMSPVGEEMGQTALRTNFSFPVLDTILCRVNNKIITGLLSERQLNLFSS
jgi:WD40 repeat protein